MIDRMWGGKCIFEGYNNRYDSKSDGKSKCIIIILKHNTLRRMVLAFALIKQMLSLKMSVSLAEIASLAMTCARKFDASLPQKSTARGVETHPKAKHFSSLAWCFLLSVASRTAPTVAPASVKVEGFSGETTEMSRAMGLS